MPNLVHGVDLVDVARIASLLDSHNDRFLDRVFTTAERRYADASDVSRAERYAARFAAKEAVFKALGCGWSGGTAWTDVGVEHLSGGAPSVVLQGRAADLAREHRIGRWHLSLTHVGGMAMASVIGTGQEHD